MDSLLLHPRTKAQLLALQSDPPQGILLVAPHGTGKRTVAATWAAAVTTPQLISIVEPDEKDTISIDTTRALYQRTRSKQPGHQVIIIDHAEAMGTEAQNALLKLLEEPRANVTFILTVPYQESLLPTVISRVQTVDVLPVASATLAAHASTVIDQQSLAQMLFVAAGRPATFVTLATNPHAFEEHKNLMQKAKKLLAATPYERLTAILELSKDRAATVAILEAMVYMLTQQIRKQPTSRSIAFADLLHTCLQRLHNNGNIRAQLTHVFAQQ